MKIFSVIIAIAIAVPALRYIERNGGDIVGCLSLVLNVAFYGFLLVMVIVLLASL